MKLFRKPHIVIAEDELQLLEAMKHTLTEAGYTVQGYSNGATFTNGVQNDDADLVILDVSMPTVNGLTSLTVMRDEYNISAPIIVFTNMRLDNEQIEIVKKYQATYVDKSETSLADLVELVRTTLAA